MGSVKKNSNFKMDIHKDIIIDKEMLLKWLISIAEFICLLLIILDCNTVLRYGDMPYNYFDVDCIKWGILSCGALIILHIIDDKNNLYVFKDFAVLLMFDIIFVVLFYFGNLVNGKTNMFIGLFLIYTNELIFLFNIYRHRKESLRLIYKLEYIVLFLTLASVILWFRACVLHQIGMREDITVVWGSIHKDVNYLNMCFRRPFEADITKNLGIFTEPPMFGLFLSYGLYTELFLKKKSNPVILAIFVLGLISCRAVLALMISLMGVGLKFLEIIEKKKISKIFIVFVCVVLAVGIVVLFWYKRKNNNASLNTHIDDFAASIKCWLNNDILFGVGFDIEAPIREYMSAFRLDNLGLSNSIAVVIAEGGILLFLYCVLPFAVMMLHFFRGNKKLAYWGMGMFGLYSVVIIHTRFIACFFIAFGYSLLNVRLKKEFPFVEIDIRNIDDNISVKVREESRDGQSGKRVKDIIIQFYDDYFTRDIFEIPRSILMVLGVIPVVVGFCSAAYEKMLDVRAMISILVTIVFTIIMLACITDRIVWRRGLLKNISKRKLVLYIELIIWAQYLLIGDMYRTLEYMFERNDLLLQQSQWKFVWLVVAIYAVTVGIDMNIKDKTYEDIKI